MTHYLEPNAKQTIVPGSKKQERDAWGNDSDNWYEPSEYDRLNKRSLLDIFGRPRTEENSKFMKLARYVGSPPRTPPHHSARVSCAAPRAPRQPTPRTPAFNAFARRCSIQRPPRAPSHRLARRVQPAPRPASSASPRPASSAFAPRCSIQRPPARHAPGVQCLRPALQHPTPAPRPALQRPAPRPARPVPRAPRPRPVPGPMYN
jgi:hypothetical protein